MGTGLEFGYGVLVGKVSFHILEPIDRNDRWPHYQIFTRSAEQPNLDILSWPPGMNAQPREMRCGINLKSRTNSEIEYIHLQDADPMLFPVFHLQPGFHYLASNKTSGALDGLRHPAFQQQNWTLAGAQELANKMPGYMANVTRLYIFGEPFGTHSMVRNDTKRLVNLTGIHDIHLNQGDPDGNGHDATNGIWQDGGIIFRHDDLTPGVRPKISVLITKFLTQSRSTDDQGVPN